MLVWVKQRKKRCKIKQKDLPNALVYTVFKKFYQFY